MLRLILNDAYASYLQSLRAVARGLWVGAIDYAQAYEALDIAVRHGITKAWYEGLKEAGFSPTEMSDAEKLELRRMLVNEQTRMDSFLTHCLDNNKASGATWATCDAKAKLWAMRASDARNKALTMAQSDPKLMWAIGYTEKHCSTCLKLNGKVKRASYWAKIGVRPQNPPNPLLECQGWRCDCRFVPTEEPLSKGPLGRLP
jgi:hypothetical protein